MRVEFLLTARHALFAHTLPTRICALDNPAFVTALTVIHLIRLPSRYDIIKLQNYVLAAPKTSR